MNGINISDVKISFGGTELTPFFISQSLKEAKTTFSTLREELPKRIKGPITVSTEILGVKSTRTYNPFDPSYNLALMSFTASVKKE
ncbi:hypothetical protein [Fibrobacter sp.]|uniref:hypothetical protein n=1 Tax=Fibrobacter sp. TaxID=35828 RepID=UPI003867044F